MANIEAKTLNEESWESYWQNRPLPILDASKTSLQQMLRRVDRVRTADVANVVLADPLLTLQALRLIGRRERSSLAAEVVSIENIVMLMGTTPFLERFCCLPTVESILLPDAAADYALFQQQVFFVRYLARLALVFADLRHDARLDEIRIASILCRSNDLLRLVGRKQDSRLPAPVPNVCPLLLRLHIPHAVIELLNDPVDAPQRVSLQASVMRLADAFQNGWWQHQVQEELDLVSSILDIQPEITWQALCRVTLSLAADPSFSPEIIQPARWLPMLPGEWPAPAGATPAESKAETQTSPVQSDILTVRMQALHLAGKQRAPAKDIMSLTVRALSEGLGMRRIAFMLLAPGQQELRARFVLGVRQDDPLRHMVIYLDPANVFTKLVEKSQGIWLNETNTAQLLPRFPENFRRCYQAQEFCLMSIFAGTKPLGVIVADRNGTDVLSEYHYQHFKQICLLTTQALGHSVGQ